MLNQAELLMSNGWEVFNKEKGLPRYIDFFDSYYTYMQHKLPEQPPQEIKIINPTPDFLEG